MENLINYLVLILTLVVIFFINKYMRKRFGYNKKEKTKYEKDLEKLGLNTGTKTNSWS